MQYQEFVHYPTIVSNVRQEAKASEFLENREERLQIQQLKPQTDVWLISVELITTQ